MNDDLEVANTIIDNFAKVLKLLLKAEMEKTDYENNLIVYDNKIITTRWAKFKCWLKYGHTVPPAGTNPKVWQCTNCGKIIHRYQSW